MLAAMAVLFLLDPWQVQTLAGPTAGGGYVDGPAREARFSRPASVAACTEAIFVADARNHAIRRISRDGVVTTWAGRLTEAGDADGLRDVARFRNPTGIAADANCGLVVADRDNHAVRRIDSSGHVTTLAGAGAGLQAPSDVAIDQDGSIWVSDNGDRAIRHIGTDGHVISTIPLPSSNVLAADAILGVALDSGGNIYVADGRKSSIYRITPAGATTTALANVSATDVAFDANGVLYFTAGVENTVQRVGSDGKPAAVAGRLLPGSSDGQGATAGFYQLDSIAADIDGTFLVADALNCLVRRVSKDGDVTTVAGTAVPASHVDGVGADARFELAADLDVDSEGVIWVADATTVRRITAGGAVTTIAGTAGQSAQVDGSRTDARFGRITGIAVEPAGTFVVIDQTTVRRVTRDGTVSTIAGMAGSPGSSNGAGSTARFDALSSVAVAPDGTIYVTESIPGTVRKIVGNVVSTFSSGHTVPMGLDVDRDGNVFLWCENDSRLFRFTPSGVMTVVATGPAGTMNGIALAPDGAVYIGGIYRHAIYRIPPGAATAERWIGDDAAIGNVNGTAEQSRFLSPTRIAVAADGRLYIRDLNRAIRVAQRIVPPQGPRRRAARP